MDVLMRLVLTQRGGAKIGLILAVAMVAYLALAGGWATAMFETIERVATRLPL
jgi:hypothetical protein